jgi:hypothetical protein
MPKASHVYSRPAKGKNGAECIERKQYGRTPEDGHKSAPDVMKEDHEIGFHAIAAEPIGTRETILTG